ncbi:MAG: hypothetical protein KJ626_03245 [Verrucomicrobia bacterium]|nr:hypothetical protein [Verrucomicrobiota bacterium]
MVRRKLKRRKRLRLWKTVRTVVLLLILAAVALPFVMKSPELPAGLNVRSGRVPVDESTTELLIDTTSFDVNTQERVIDQTIFDAALRMISEADHIVYMDLFLWNTWQGAIPEDHRNLAEELATALIEKKRTCPHVDILAVTDPINRIYGNMEEALYERLADAGIPVVFTDLNRLPDSNFLYARPAKFYERLLKSVGPVQRWLDKPRVTNPFNPGGPDISARQMARLLLFKANHRKVVITDDGREQLRLLVASWNPANGSSAHSNMGLLLDGEVARLALTVELDAVAWSIEKAGNVLETSGRRAASAVVGLREYLQRTVDAAIAPESGAEAEWLTEGQIKNGVIELLDDAGPRDEVRIAMFYLSDRDVVRAIKDAAYGGADVRVILDPNRDAFGRYKNGVPNRPVAAGLLKYAAGEGVNIDVRWADTHGEQFHTKAMSIFNGKTGKFRFICGSANWTRRNIGGLNMEANVALYKAPSITTRFNSYFDTLWDNSDGLSHTLDYEAFADEGWRLLKKTVLYRIQEPTGLCTF